MLEYVVGFMFNNEYMSDVLLIEKKRPTWQAGKLNGIGGKLELNETPHQAMVREFEEETGIRHELWTKTATCRGKGYNLHVFACIGQAMWSATPKTDETLYARHVPSVHLNLEKCIPNLGWLVEMAKLSLRYPNTPHYSISGGPIP